MIYNRQLDLAETVHSLKEEIEELKSSQVVGNDNLIIHFYQQSVGPESITTAGANFRAQFVFDDPPIDTFVSISFTYFYTGIVSIETLTYSDPATIDSLSAQGSIFRVLPASNVTDVFIFASAKSTSPGSLSLVRL